MQKIAEFHKIKLLSETIAKAVKPLQIYLFGSFATGKQNAESDYDFFIIVKDNEDTNIAYSVICKAIRGKRNRPIDILVATKKKFEKNKKNIFRIENEIMKEGILIYG